MTYETYSIFLHPVLIIDRQGAIVYANDACEEAFGYSVRTLRSMHFPQSFGLNPAADRELFYTCDTTAYVSASFDTGSKKGETLYAVQPLPGSDRNGRLLVCFYDRSVEMRLLQKYQGERAQREDLEEQVLNQRADLLIVNNQLERKITQTEFLLKFYARTRFALETDAIGRQFLQLACTELGFRHGYFITRQAEPNQWRLTAYYYPEIDKELSTRLQAQSQKPLVDPPLAKRTDRVTLYEREQLNSPDLNAFYANLGVTPVANGVVFSLVKDGQAIGEFHFLNYVHNQQIGSSAIDMLKYMVDPVHLTFENAELYRTSVTDELTQINNVRYFRICLHNEIARAQKDQLPLALLMLDIDHFKSINDKYGHQTGDLAIRAMANALKMGVRGGDVVARYGGEEMAAILPGASPETAMVVAERLRTHVAEIVIDSNQGPVRFTTSIGVGLYPTDAADGEGLIHCADQALYRAKREGRNRVIKF